MEILVKDRMNVSNVTEKEPTDSQAKYRTNESSDGEHVS
jgi:hypothetical protein